MYPPPLQCESIPLLCLYSPPMFVPTPVRGYIHWKGWACHIGGRTLEGWVEGLGLSLWRAHFGGVGAFYIGRYRGYLSRGCRRVTLEGRGPRRIIYIGGGNRHRKVNLHWREDSRGATSLRKLQRNMTASQVTLQIFKVIQNLGGWENVKIPPTL